MLLDYSCLRTCRKLFLTKCDTTWLLRNNRGSKVLQLHLGFLFWALFRVEWCAYLLLHVYDYFALSNSWLFHLLLKWERPHKLEDYFVLLANKVLVIQICCLLPNALEKPNGLRRTELPGSYITMLLQWVYRFRNRHRMVTRIVVLSMAIPGVTHLRVDLS